MWTQTIWWGAIGLEALLLLRSAANRLFSQFPLFYSYIACVLIVDLARFYCYQVHPSAYARFYFYSELLTAIVGYGIILELYERSLQQYPGVVRFAQGLLLSVLAVVVLASAAIVLRHADPSMGRAVSLIERDLRLAQAFLFIVLLALLAHYGIATGKNLRGLTLGYALFIGFRTVQLACYMLFKPASKLSSELQPMVYVFVLLVWTRFLWSRHLEPAPGTQREIEQDYGSLVAATRTTLLRARAYIGRGVRP